MHSKIILLLAILLFYNCEHKKVDYRSGLLTIYFFQIKPALDRGSQCTSQNSIPFSYFSNQYCIDTKVSDGLIFDANTLVGVKTDTISPGISLFCQCGDSGVSLYEWDRGTKIEDNPQPIISTSYIFSSPTATSFLVKKPLIYKTHYNQPDNLYCITECPINSKQFQYQFLKIR